jgi:hypothetical protein
MRVVSCLAAVAWLLTVAEPCLRPAVCSTPVGHQCCCEKDGQCSCHVNSQRTPAPLPLATAQISQDEQGLPTPQVTLPAVTRVVVTAPAGTLFEPVAPSAPVYLSTRAFRC